MSGSPVAQKTHQQVEVMYNGVLKEFHYRPEERVEHLLNRARREFNVTLNPHLMGLFAEDGHELTDAQTLSEAHVEPDQELILRQSRVRGGGRRC